MAVSESTPQPSVQLDPDVRLMLEVRDDNAAAFEELVLRYQGRLVAILEHLVGRRERAEDLAQEVFLRVYRARKRYEPAAKFSTWLFTIANHVASNSLRSLARRREVNLTAAESGAMGVDPLDQLALAASGEAPVRRIDAAERSEIVRLAMDSLNDRQRMALLLSKFEGMSYVEVAETMGLSIQAVKSLLSRARGNLRTVLEPYMQDGTRPADGGEDPPGGKRSGSGSGKGGGSPP